MLEKTLEQIGLNEKQAKIYLACLELGETAIKEIAIKSGVKRTTIYDIITDMVNAGFIKTTTKGKKRMFVAVSPEDLKVIIKKREVLLEQIMPQLALVSNVSQVKPKMWFYEGTQGLKQVYDNILNFKDIVIHGWASKDILNVLGDEWAMDYIRKRVKRNISAKFIIAISSSVQKYVDIDKAQLRKSKLVDPKKYPFKIEVNIYANRVAFISARDRIGVIIESEPIAQTMKMIFKLCWDNLPMSK